MLFVVTLVAMVFTIGQQRRAERMAAVRLAEDEPLPAAARAA